MTPSTTAPARRPAAARWRAAARAWLAALAGLGGFCAPAAAADTVRIAASRGPIALPLFVAQQRGYFADEHLDVTLRDCVGGTRCLRQVLDGAADLATSSEMPVLLQGFARADVAILATITQATDNLKLIARKASGVVRGEQLAGRRVGVIAGTAAQYVLETHLLNVGVDPHEVQMVPLQAEETVAALASGRIDAVAVWEPYGYAAVNGPDAPGVRLPLSGRYIERQNLVGRRSWLVRQDDAMVRLLRALQRSEEFIQAQPAQAQAILRARLGLDQHFVDWVWGGLAFQLSLDQALVTTMEGEARWAQREGHVAGGVRPDVLDLIEVGPLKIVRPAAVGTGG